jgi:aspartyl-tRNA synthetase
MSFFPIKDFSGITQLVVRKGHENAHLTTLSEIPVESTIAIEGQVLVRPELSRRDVSRVFFLTSCHRSRHSSKLSLRKAQDKLKSK